MEEQREKERININYKPKGVMKLIVEDESKDVQLIGNISPFGMMVQIKKNIDVNTDVGLFYTIENINFEILGTVKWAKTIIEEGPDRPNSFCQLGISFWPQNLKENLDLYTILSTEE